MTINAMKYVKTAAFLGAAAILAACHHDGMKKDSGYSDKAYSDSSYKDDSYKDDDYGDGDVCPKVAPTPIEFADQRATPAEIAMCEAAGGSVSPQGLLGFDMCVQPHCDAGQVCSDSSECIGKCFTTDTSSPTPPTTGACQPTNSPFGCRTEVTGGVANVTICVD